MKLEAAIAEASQPGASKKIMLDGETFYIEYGELFADEDFSDETHLSASEAISDGWSVVPVSRAKSFDQVTFASAWESARASGFTSIKAAGQSDFYKVLLQKLFS